MIVPLSPVYNQLIMVVLIYRTSYINQAIQQAYQNCMKTVFKCRLVKLQLDGKLLASDFVELKFVWLNIICQTVCYMNIIIRANCLAKYYEPNSLLYKHNYKG